MKLSPKMICTIGNIWRYLGVSDLLWFHTIVLDRVDFIVYNKLTQLQ